MTFDLSTVVDVFRAISDSAAYRAALVFYGAYPITMACVWIVLSVSFARRREGKANPVHAAAAGAATTPSCGATPKRRTGSSTPRSGATPATR